MAAATTKKNRTIAPTMAAVFVSGVEAFRIEDGEIDHGGNLKAEGIAADIGHWSESQKRS